MLHDLQFRNRNVFENLPPHQKKSVFVIRFEDLVTNTMENVIEIANFLDTKITKSTKRSISKQGCPRKLPSGKRDSLYDHITSQCSKSSNELIDKMIKDYEVNWE